MVPASAPASVRRTAGRCRTRVTVADMTGQQVSRAEADPEGVVRTGPRPAGRHTAIVSAIGYAPSASAAQVGTAGTMRDEHLRGTDFLDVERFPVITYTGTTWSRPAATAGPSTASCG
jgi:hypothetical protein